MKALITAGGRATRLRPITHTINKHLIPLANKRMIAYAIEKVVEAGITDIGINVNPGDTEIPAFVGDGSRWNAHVTCIEQTGGPKGLAHILKAARPFLGDEPFLFYLGDNIILGSLKKFVETFRSRNLNCLLALSKVKDPQRFGVPEFKDGRIVRVEEKPSQPKSDFAVTGIYLYDKSVWPAVEAISPSARGEYEISDVHTWLIEHGERVGHEEITGWWKDTGKPEDLLEGNRLLLLEKARLEETYALGIVDSSAVIDGDVWIGRGTVVGPGARIHGPVVIGEDCRIENATVGPDVSIGDRVKLSRAEIAGSIIFDGAIIDCGERIEGSIIGQDAVITSSHASGHKLLLGDNAQIEL